MSRLAWCLLGGCLAILAGVELYGSFLSVSPVFRGGHVSNHSSESLETELLHLTRLNDICMAETEAIIPWTYNSPTIDRSLVYSKDMPLATLLGQLAECPDVDVFLPNHLHGHGYCEDAMAYVKFLKARSLPLWVFDIVFNVDGTNQTYFDLCPKSAILFLNHYWDHLHERPTFPRNKTVILMPNIEMYELKAEHYNRADIVLAKTKDAYRRITYKQSNSIDKSSAVRFTQHTSSDPTVFLQPLPPKNFDKLTIFHAGGSSAHKNTPAILDCWQSRPDFPTVHIYSKNKWYSEHLSVIPSNVDLNLGGEMSSVELGRKMAEASVILCPSAMEGFGHYINQARASGALVVTTNGTPMNEFVDNATGVLIDATPRQQGGEVLMGENTEWNVEANAICAAVDKVLAMSPSERKAKARAGRLQYEEQVHFFENAMNQLRQHLKQQSLRLI
ncbi:hypothetical protein Ae201684P_020490 [Aphanomyces euteiches]|nr:hypothetical protein Ae201684P_020490 [Aphanomyces euteiches]